MLSRRAHEAPPSIRGRQCATICRRTLSSSTGWLVSVGVRSLLFLGRHHTSYVQQQQQPRDRQFLQVIGVMHPPEWWCVLGMTQRRERERERQCKEGRRHSEGIALQLMIYIGHGKMQSTTGSQVKHGICRHLSVDMRPAKKERKKSSSSLRQKSSKK